MEAGSVIVIPANVKHWHGAKKLCLITISGLKPAIHLYKKFGFVEIPYRKDVWHSEKADVEMEYIVKK